MKPRPYMLVMGAIMLFTIYKKTNFQHQHAEMETRFHPFDSIKESDAEAIRVGYLPQGIVQPSSDLELKPLWFTKSSTWKGGKYSHRSLLAMAVGIKQKKSVNAIVDKFFSEKFTVILFHYDGNVDEWHDLWWSNRAIHIVIYDQTKWWFAKRFLHPDVVSVYDYIFLWDEDLGVDHFHPGRYLKIMKSEGLEISHPALDPHISEIHHRITVRRKKGNAHRGFLIIDVRENVHMPVMIPCTGLVEGMAPVFSRSAWRCVWHLIQDDLIHGWGTDMKLGYCAQGDRMKRIGIIDSEFIVHHGLQTLGGSSTEKYIPPLHQKFLHRLVQKSGGMPKKNASGIRGARAFDSRIEVRRQATLELQKFQERWERAVREDKDWVDPFQPCNTSSKNYTFIASRSCNGSSKNHTSNAPPPCSSSSKNHTSYTPPPCNGSSKNHSAIAPPPQNGSRNNHTSSVSLPHNTSSRSHVSSAHLRRNRGSKGHTSTARLPRYKSNRNHKPSARLARYRSSRNHAF